MDITHLIEPEIICLDLKANNKEDVLIELVELLDNAGKLTDKQQFLNDIWRREEIGNTGFEEGIAIPHAKSAAVALPAVVVGISRQGIDYGAEDGQLSDVFFMLASPDGEDHHHIEVLAQISSKLIEEGFVEQLKAAESVEQALALFIHPHHSTLSSTPIMDYAVYRGGWGITLAFSDDVWSRSGARRGRVGGYRSNGYCRFNPIYGGIGWLYRLLDGR
ncbi:PTS system fructose-specific transporter subunit IIABC [Vibrio cholerae]|nr:PTS system fructose-specific transporter subunit IIABC [Vibrio cholerae]CSD37584.1 PTS system fructose-specific transporter subunit IIABC [Vibrio cholerae]